MFTVLTILCYYHCVIGRRSPHVLMNYLLSHSFFVLKLLLAETTLSLGPFLAAFRRRTVILQATKIRRCVVPRAAHYGGQTDGACSSVVTPTANPNIGKYYADYAAPWPIAGCKNNATQLECCKGAFGGQISGACIMGLPTLQQPSLPHTRRQSPLQPQPRRLQGVRPRLPQ